MYKFPKKTTQIVHQQTVDDFKKESSRRAPSESCRTIVFHEWPKNATTRREMKHLLEFSQKFYPKVRFVLDPEIHELKAKLASGMTERYRNENYYVAGKLLDSLALTCDTKKVGTKEVKEVKTTIFGHVLITNVLIVSRPGITTAGLARRESGFACYSTNKSSPMTLVHEIGHLFGLRHCQLELPTCIMVAGKDDTYTSTKKRKGSELSQTFCEDCMQKITIAGVI